MRVASTEVQNNFGKYMKIAAELEDVVITRNGREYVKLVPCEERFVVSEEAVNYIVGGNRKMSYAEFIEMTEKSDQRYELIDGEVFYLEAPSYSHQTAIMEILAAMYAWFKGKECKPLPSPFDITLEKSKENICVVQPDIVVICDLNKINERDRYMGVPSLAVEVLSPSTKRKDMIKKLDLYLQTGVKEYWLVDTEKKEILLYTFEKLKGENEIKDFIVLKDADTVSSKVFEGLEIKLQDIFAV